MALPGDVSADGDPTGTRVLPIAPVGPDVAERLEALACETGGAPYWLFFAPEGVRVGEDHLPAGHYLVPRAVE